MERYFTKEFIDDHGYFDPYYDVDWKTVDIEIKNTSGDVIYSLEGARFPSHFSQTACEIIASKYFYRGADENNYLDLCMRMVKFWIKGLSQEGILTSEYDKDIFFDETLYALIYQYWAPNSPQWFNSGLKLQYGVDAKSDDMYYCDARGLMQKSEDRYTRSQSSACFILDIEDQLLGEHSITDHYVTETKLFKGGSGCGTNFSPLRAVGEKLSSGGTSSGLMSYLKGLDVNAGTIKSGGTTRRAAKMVVVDIDHPEIEEFIDWKVKEERKAKALINAGYDGSIGGEAYSTVSGQNSNNSIMIPDDFMFRCLDHKDFVLEGRVDHSVDKVVDANELMEKICKAAWECGDPGVMFYDQINLWNTCAESGNIRSSNPCGEFLFLDNTACNLSSINLEKVIGKDGIDLDAIDQLVMIAQLVMESSIYLGQYPTREIARNSFDYRPTGLGFTGLAGALETLGVAYDTEEARLFASLISALLTSKSFLVSAEMADLIGPFPLYDLNRESMESVLIDYDENYTVSEIHNQKITEIGTLRSVELNTLRRRITNNFSMILDHVGEGKGFRNAQVTCIAPTGTISLAMDCSSTGIEPYFSRKSFKKLADGSVIEKEIQAIKTADEIAPIDHVKMVSAIQEFITGGVSKTVNLPNSATVEDVKDIYFKAWELGCKSITIYRDGSKGTQVLDKEKEEVYEVNEKDNEKLNRYKDLKKELYSDSDIEVHTKDELDFVLDLMKRDIKRTKPDGIRNSRTHSAKIGSIQLYITVGYYNDGALAEIFVNTDKQGEVVNGLLDGLSKSLSHLLQYGVEPEKISKILRGQKYEPSGIVERHPNIKFADSISDLISKVIDIEIGDYSRVQVKDKVDGAKVEFIEEAYSIDEMEEIGKNTFGEDLVEKWTDAEEVVDDLFLDNFFNDMCEETVGEEIYGEECSNCGSTNLVRSGTCKTCLVCGTTTGCG